MSNIIREDKRRHTIPALELYVSDFPTPGQELQSIRCPNCENDGRGKHEIMFCWTELRYAPIFFARGDQVIGDISNNEGGDDPDEHSYLLCNACGHRWRESNKPDAIPNDDAIRIGADKLRKELGLVSHFEMTLDGERVKGRTIKAVNHELQHALAFGAPIGFVVSAAGVSVVLSPDNQVLGAFRKEDIIDGPVRA